MEFVDPDGNIIVPKAVRPIVDIEETLLGSKKAADRQYRYGNLHIRDYGSHYAVHTDKIDPREDPLGHLLVDAPEFIVGALVASYVGPKVGKAIYEKGKKEGKSLRDAAIDGLIIGLLAGSSAGKWAFSATNAAKKVG